MCFKHQKKDLSINFWEITIKQWGVTTCYSYNLETWGILVGRRPTPQKKPAAGNQRQNPPGQNLSIPIQSPKQYKNWSFAATIHPFFLKNVPSGNSINYFVHSYGNWPTFFHKHYDLPIRHYDFPVCWVSHKHQQNKTCLNAIRGEIRLTPAGIVLRKGLQGLRSAHGNLHDPAVDEVPQGAQELGEVDAWWDGDPNKMWVVDV